MRNVFFILLIALMTTSSIFGQITIEKVRLPELKIIDDNLTIVLDSLLSSEKLCDYYHDSLYLEIDIYNHNWRIGEDCRVEDTMLVVIYAITYKPFLFITEQQGFLILENHLCTVQGILLPDLFLKSGNTKILEYKKKNTTYPIVHDDSKSIWSYYYINGEFILENSYPKCPR